MTLPTDVLTDGQIDRYSRQVILPEVGGRGQVRLLTARVLLAGGDEAARSAATLLGRAGVGALDLLDGPAALPELSPDCRLTRHAGGAPLPDAAVMLDLTGDPASAATLGRHAARAGRPFVIGVQRGARGVVATLVGQPCGACLPAATLAGGDAPPATPAVASSLALAVGALAASEALGLLLGAANAGRAQHLDVAAGTCVALALPRAAGCVLCGGSA